MKRVLVNDHNQNFGMPPIGIFESGKDEHGYCTIKLSQEGMNSILENFVLVEQLEIGDCFDFLGWSVKVSAADQKQVSFVTNGMIVSISHADALRLYQLAQF